MPHLRHCSQSASLLKSRAAHHLKIHETSLLQQFTPLSNSDMRLGSSPSVIGVPPGGLRQSQVCKLTQKTLEPAHADHSQRHAPCATSIYSDKQRRERHVKKYARMGSAPKGNVMAVHSLHHATPATLPCFVDLHRSEVPSSCKSTFNYISAKLHPRRPTTFRSLNTTSQTKQSNYLHHAFLKTFPLQAPPPRHGSSPRRSLLPLPPSRGGSPPPSPPPRGRSSPPRPLLSSRKGCASS